MQLSQHASLNSPPKINSNFSFFFPSLAYVQRMSNTAQTTLPQIEAINLGREWLENAPPFDGVSVGPDFMSGAAGCVCRGCCRRIVARGCDLRRIANVPIWEATVNDACDLCGFPVRQEQESVTRSMAMDAGTPESPSHLSRNQTKK